MYYRNIQCLLWRCHLTWFSYVCHTMYIVTWFFTKLWTCRYISLISMITKSVMTSFLSIKYQSVCRSGTTKWAKMCDFKFEPKSHKVVMCMFWLHASKTAAVTWSTGWFLPLNRSKHECGAYNDKLSLIMLRTMNNNSFQKEISIILSENNYGSKYLITLFDALCQHPRFIQETTMSYLFLSSTYVIK